MNPRFNADMRGSSRESQQETSLETVALSIARVLAGGAGFLLGLACITQATANPAFIFCPPSDAQVHGRLGAARALRKQFSQCIKLFMSSRLREDLVPHVYTMQT